MTTAKARITLGEDHHATVPIVVPSLDEVRRFAHQLHAQGEPWHGEAFDWSAEYHPQRSEPPLDSRMTFTPADFCIGESGIWFFSMMWEQGGDQLPVEFLDDRNVRPGGEKGGGGESGLHS